MSVESEEGSTADLSLSAVVVDRYQDDDLSTAAGTAEVVALGEPGLSTKGRSGSALEPADVQALWDAVCASYPSSRAAGQELLERVKETAPDTKELFKKNTAAIGHNVWSALCELVRTYPTPTDFQPVVHGLALRHLGLALTESHVRCFRDALLGHCAEACGEEGFATLSDFLAPLVMDVGRAFMQLRAECEGHMEIVRESWHQVCHASEAEVVRGHSQAHIAKAATHGDVQNGGHADDSSAHRMLTANIAVPKTFQDMLAFNAVVMQIGSRPWLPVLMDAMDGLVTSVAEPSRFQEEAEVLALQLARFGAVSLDEFRAVMLATLRSLLAGKADARHEEAWAWFWTLLKQRLARTPAAKLAADGAALRKFFDHFSEEKLDRLKISVFESFFKSCEEAHDYLRVSNSRLVFIMGRIFGLMGSLYEDSAAVVKDLSALGLTHAGWGVKPELLPVLADAAMGTLREEMHDQHLESAAWWSLDLISRILDRTLLEGSTAVMRAISANSGRQLRRAVAGVARGERAVQLLNVMVGTESISPLLWAVQTSALSTASAILTDLLTIRADRARYYYGMDALFERHPDVVELLCARAPTLLPQLFDGLIWRSSRPEDGRRRVNYYIRHVLVDSEGMMKPSFAKLIAHGDPVVILHPFATFLLGLLWRRYVFLFFLTKVWFLITLVDFIVGLQYGIMMFDSDGPGRWALISCRLFMYIFSLGQLLLKHAGLTAAAIRARDFRRVFGVLPVPAYLLESRQSFVEALLACFLILMLSCEPFLHCLRVNPHFITNCCEYGEWYCQLSDSYDRISSIPQILYFILFADMLQLNLYLSTCLVVFLRLLKGFVTFIGAVLFIASAFASGIACLPQNGEFQRAHFYNFPSAFMSLLRMGINAYSHNEEVSDGPADLAAMVAVFRIVVQIALLNFMVAQLVHSFTEAHRGAFGHACLLRGKNIVNIVHLLSKNKWLAWIHGLRMQEPTELDKGEFGPSGGVQVLESASATAALTLDNVRRFGGLTAPELPWPPEHSSEDKESEVEALRALIEKRFAAIEKAVGVGDRSENRSRVRSTSSSQGSCSSLHG